MLKEKAKSEKKYDHTEVWGDVLGAEGHVQGRIFQNQQ